MSLKNPRFTSSHSGREPQERRAPATVSASTSAITPADPLTPAASRIRPYSLPAACRRPRPSAFGGRRVGLRAMNDWRSYDDVAETYERVHAPRFAEVARDLVALAELEPRASACSTSGPAPASPRRPPSESGARVVGIDASTGMLDGGPPRAAVAHARGRRGDRPAVPRRHVRRRDRELRARALPKYETALFDMIRVLRPGRTHRAHVVGRRRGRPPGDLARAGRARWCRARCSSPPRRRPRPWHERFADRQAVEEALIDAGLRHVRTEKRQYRFDVLAGRLPRRARDLGDRPVRARDARRRRLAGVPGARPRHVRRAVPRSAERLPRRDPRRRHQAVAGSDRSAEVQDPERLGVLDADLLRRPPRPPSASNSSKNRIPSASWLACAASAAIFALEVAR